MGYPLPMDTPFRNASIPSVLSDAGERDMVKRIPPSHGPAFPATGLVFCPFGTGGWHSHSLSPRVHAPLPQVPSLNETFPQTPAGTTPVSRRRVGRVGNEPSPRGLRNWALVNEASPAPAPRPSWAPPGTPSPTGAGRLPRGGTQRRGRLLPRNSGLAKPRFATAGFLPALRPLDGGPPPAPVTSATPDPPNDYVPPKRPTPGQANKKPPNPGASLDPSTSPR
ncbi:MAG: hypothetical protein CM15mP18_4380 [Methanobacteriota archaeon]|nr:MAG: hypothetical protein CM15mP18_4380 [Euryarchaeota archaeon]